jgi:DNA replication and repair protein RecF
MPLSLHKITLTHFRSYEALRLDFGGARLVVLTGSNGAGKTNILEAISLLIPGKGLRGADLLDMKSRQAGATEAWAVAAEIETAEGKPARLGTGLDREAKRRVVRVNGEDAKTQNALSACMSVVWLTPQMDRLFLEGASDRRKFFDRLVFAAEPGHAARLNAYDRNLRERLKILQLEAGADPRWLDQLENQLAADAVAIAAARNTMIAGLMRYVGRLLDKIPGAVEGSFPLPSVAVAGWTETALGGKPAVEVETELRSRFRASRQADALAGKSHEGIHRSDFAVTHAARAMPAAQCSTGEQKGLLISIVLAHALMTAGEKGFVPVLLLDEVAAHLDETRRRGLLRMLGSLGGQVFLTGTDSAVFQDLRDTTLFPRTLFCAVENGRVTPELRAVAPNTAASGNT